MTLFAAFERQLNVGVLSGVWLSPLSSQVQIASTSYLIGTGFMLDRSLPLWLGCTNMEVIWGSSGDTGIVQVIIKPVFETAQQDVLWPVEAAG